MSMKVNILSIDAWRDPDGWTWNNWFKLRENVELPDDITTRQILKYMRDEGFLSDRSKGHVAIDDDQYNLVVIDRGTREPIFALEYGSYL